MRLVQFIISFTICKYGVSKGYRPEARGYVIYSPRALFEGAALGQHTRGIGHLQDPGTWYGINYTGTQMTQWDFQNKGTHTSPA